MSTENSLQPKPVSASQTQHSILITPASCDSQNMCFAGKILAEIDIVASIACRRHSGFGCVTASLDGTTFVGSIYSGDLVTFYASVNRTWRTSLEVGVLVTAENPHSRVVRTCCHSYLTFVARKDGHSVPVPPVIPETDQQRLRYERADQRRQARLQKKTTKTPVLEPVHLSTGSLPTLKVPSNLPGQVSVLSSQTLVTRTIVVFPQDANPGGTTFGGKIMEFLETAAMMSAQRFCKGHTITASLDSVNFSIPTKVGNILVVTAFVTAAFNSSMEVYATCMLEDAATGTRSMTNDGFVTLVNVDSTGSRVPVPNLICDTEASKELNKFAEGRRQLRLLEREESLEAARKVNERRKSFIME